VDATSPRIPPTVRVGLRAAARRASSDESEIWQHAAGEAIELRTWTEGDPAVTTHRSATDLAPGSKVQAVVPAGSSQAARPLGSWGLVGCIVAPAFEFAGFELAPTDWEPPLDG